MICPKCKELGLKSRVNSHGTFVTAAGYDRYYDEDGKYHSHDTNRHSEGFSCSNGHSFSRNYRPQCPSCDFGKDSESVEVIDTKKSS